MVDENITKMMSAIKEKNMMEHEAIEIKMELKEMNAIEDEKELEANVKMKNLEMRIDDVVLEILRYG